LSEERAKGRIYAFSYEGKINKRMNGASSEVKSEVCFSPSLNPFCVCVFCVVVFVWLGIGGIKKGFLFRGNLLMMMDVK